MERNYKLYFEAPNRWYDAALRAVAPLLAKNKNVIKELRVRQPEISKIDEKLLVEIAGIELDQARFLCADFQNYWRPAMSWGELATGGAQLFANGLRSIMDQWKS